MQNFEQMQRTKHKRTVEQIHGTFPEDRLVTAHGGDDDSDIDDLLATIDQVITSNETFRALGRATGIEAA
jgi:hypothetical protein